ncbi:dienelactone hydrolase family protein [Endozoicomonas sp. G2_2]|uniref:dienelactone hydrolase family protein n=1 Tax=Endozoicomonas sp. G2_2 TaxID=2821092 RepID=UPI001ADC8175|nr:dienelactone hydrolase family protein [Endozoicomonas sp. G2_2]MBO9470550.1 dienelactone hydrolase family protein [Endozoicomonas sp. G2_2]
MTVDTITLDAPDGSRFDAYRALPECGYGPAVIVLQEIFGVNRHIREVCDFYAEEGYVAIAPDLFHQFAAGIELGYEPADFEQAFDYFQRLDVDRTVADIGATVTAARRMDAVVADDSAGGVGVVGFCLGGKLAYLAAAHCDVDAAVGYYGVGIDDALDLADRIRCPMALHFGGHDKFSPPATIEKIRAAFDGRDDVQIFVYDNADHAFTRWGNDHYNPGAARLAHTRTLAVLRAALGPHYDLAALADHHFELEFAARDVDETMKTMVAEPYVNHVPTMTGGTGYENLKRFYKHHFIPKNPADLQMKPISRTVGVDRMVDEFVLCFTHDCEIDWLLPGIEPTGKYVEIPFVVIVAFRGDKLYNEHIYWDQASLLVQIGKLDPAGLPIAGVETARKLLDKEQPSNDLMPNWATSAGKD